MNRYQQAEGCPGCGRIEGVELTRTTSRVSTWKCTRCGLNWAVSVVNPHQRGDYPAALAARVERLSAARLILGEVITLADKASAPTDLELRDPDGKYIAVCGWEVLPGSWVTPPRGRCGPCRLISAQRVAR